MQCFVLVDSMAATIVTVQIFTSTTVVACWLIRGPALHQFLFASTKSSTSMSAVIESHQLQNTDV